MTEDPRPYSRSSFERLIGGRPVPVLVKLVVISLLVGFGMALFGLDPASLVRGVVDLIEEALRDGAGVFRQMGAYIITGAVIVVPIWLLLRLTRAR